MNLINYQKNILSIKFSRTDLVSNLDLTNLVDLSHKSNPPKTMVPFVPVPSKPTTTRLESEEEEGIIETEEKGPSWIQIPHPLVPSAMLPSPSMINAYTRQLAGNISRYSAPLKPLRVDSALRVILLCVHF